jgi:hypothetical protein
MCKADEYRKEARAAEGRAKKSTSLRVAALERKRAESLYALAENEDWLDGKLVASIAAD